MLLLDAKEISVRFGGHMAVDGADLSVVEQSITGLIGPNGAGKTTMFNVICGLQAPASGRVSFDGVDITGRSTHQRARLGLARTFQRLELFGSLTVLENLQVASEIRRPVSSGRTPTQRVERAIDQTGIHEFLHTRADVVTTGQARLVELARALVTEPRLLLLDEPASGLDTAETERFGDLLELLAGEGLGILLVEHDVSLVMRVCEQIAVLDYGRIIGNGTPDQVRADPKVMAAYLGTPVSAEP